MTDHDPLAVLRALGESPDEVAASLLALGCRGMPAQHSSCPVARYMLARGFEGAAVDNRRMEWDDGRRVVLPPPVFDFVRRFDQGEYPALVEPP
jgi:hypothetical protein